MALSDNSKFVHMTMGGLQFFGWWIAMAGLASMQNQVNASWAYSLQWFILFFQLALVIALPVLAMSGYVRKVATAFACYYAIVSTLLALFAYEAYSTVRMVDGSVVNPARLNTWIAGCSFIFMFNVVTILLLSLDKDDDRVLNSAKPVQPQAIPPPFNAGGPTVSPPFNKGGPTMDVNNV